MNERRLLQVAVATASLVPILAGAAGVVLGPAMVEVAGAPTAADSHYRYLSGLLLGIGLAFAAAIPHIERHAGRFRLLGAIVVIGGAARLVSLLIHGYAGGAMLFALAMELVVTPTIVLWQARVAAEFRR